MQAETDKIGDCPTCLYTYDAKTWRSGCRLCTHPDGELYAIDTITPCRGWKPKEVNQCDYGHETGQEIRALPYGSNSGNILCCYTHYRQEMRFRGEDTPKWSTLKIYSPCVYSHEKATHATHKRPL